MTCSIPIQIGDPATFWVALLLGIATAYIGVGWLWNVVGREEVTARPGLLTIRYALGGIFMGIGFTRSYSWSDQHRFRVSPIPFSWFTTNGNNPSEGNIALDFETRTVRFGQKTSEVQARELVALLERHLLPSESSPAVSR